MMSPLEREVTFSFKCIGFLTLIINIYWFKIRPFLWIINGTYWENLNELFL